jgi:hypothetical protein
LQLVKEFQPLNKTCIETSDEFNVLHNHLIDLVAINSQNRAPIFDKSEFEAFENIMKKFRQNIEKLIIQNTVIITELNIVKQEVSDLKKIVFEKEFKKLSNSISKPIKEDLVKYFREKRLRIDPLHECLMECLLKNHYDNLYISKNEFYDIMNFYKQLSNEMKINNYEDLIYLMDIRRQRNIEEHEFIDGYLKTCTRKKQTPDFSNLLETLNLTPLKTYKKNELNTLEKVFIFYCEKEKYRQ